MYFFLQWAEFILFSCLMLVVCLIFSIMGYYYVPLKPGDVQQTKISRSWSAYKQISRPPKSKEIWSTWKPRRQGSNGSLDSAQTPVPDSGLSHYYLQAFFTPAWLEERNSVTINWSPSLFSDDRGNSRTGFFSTLKQGPWGVMSFCVSLNSVNLVWFCCSWPGISKNTNV